MANVVGFRVAGAVPGQQEAAAGPGRGPLHAVEGVTGRAARESASPVQALCGEWVRVALAEEVPADTGLCRDCEYAG